MRYKILFLIPYYNHPQTIVALVERLRECKIDILIIDDGSNALSKQALSDINEAVFLRDFDDSHATNKHTFIYTRQTNGGKGAALKDGLKLAEMLGYTHAFQIDADMQHDLNIIDTFLHASSVAPTNLILGNPIYDDKIPKSRLYGRKITAFWVCINTISKEIKDSMCGMRIYPISEIKQSLKLSTSNRMDFDVEILLYAHKLGVKMNWIDVKVDYKDDTISHFNTIKDNILIGKIHAKHAILLPIFIIKKTLKRLANAR